MGGDICLFLIHLLQLLQHGTKCSLLHHKAEQEIFDEISTQFGAAAPNVAVLSPLLNYDY